MDHTTREFAIALAQQAGALLCEILARGLDNSRTRAKRGHFDIVTEADFASEHLIVNALTAAYPSHGIHAEESAGGDLPADEWLWLVDPVDGTNNFAHGLPLFAVNLALAHRGVPVLGVTHDPANGRTYWAEHKGGAWLRQGNADRQLAVSTVTDLRQALLATGFVAGRGKWQDHNRAEFWQLDAASQSVRRLGSAALALAWIAAGHLEGYWETELKPWDVAAGWVLITEAGGRLTEHAGTPFRLNSRTLTASNGQPGIHEAIMATIASAQMEDAADAN